MSLIITLHGQEGIVMASDSRLTFTNTDDVNGQKVVNFGVSQTDTSYKTFLGKGNIGISTFGVATIKGTPITGYVESFLTEKVTSEIDIDSAPQLLVDYFRSTPEIPDAGFHVAGYKSANNQRIQKIWRVFPAGSSIQEVVPKQQLAGALWNGEQDVLTRLLNQKIYFQNDQGTFDHLPSYGIPFEMFTLQDMIDFAVYGIRATTDTMRFQIRGKTVGGPIDVLVIKPIEAFWISRKTLQKRESN
jgi:hypothetical protein